MVEKVKLNSFNQVVKFLSSAEGCRALVDNRRGIEREALRVTPDAKLALNPHPHALGSPLTHSRITTDYSESLLEFITPVSTNIDELLTGLTQTHAYTIQHLNDQQLWPVSMPCYVEDEAAIPVAQFGSSNIGRMKTLYRTGLTHRYGAMMQIISGVHFNFSVSDALWEQLYKYHNIQTSKQAFISESYLGLIRNYRRLMWVLPYLFGASPAICSSFIKDQDVNFAFEALDSKTFYLPYATSLRLSDLGYTNKEQEKLGISYNSLDEYLTAIKKAIKMSSSTFEKLGLKVDGEYVQLNTNILQIENEFYAPIRAKRVTQKGEKPSEALERAGVEYIEVRALDVNPFSAVGIDEFQIRFLDLFLLYCLLMPSAKATKEEELEIAANFKKVVLEGRKPNLELAHDGQLLTLKTWLSKIFTDLTEIAILLDKEKSNNAYQDALAHWQACIDDPQKTLSGLVMADILSNSHGNWAMNLAEKYQHYFQDYPLSSKVKESFEREAVDSVAAQSAIELGDTVDFDTFLADYFAN